MPLLATVTVESAEQISPSFIRIELGGEQLADFGVDGPVYDQRIKVLLPGPYGLPELSHDNWWADYQALPELERGYLRTYTIRDVLGTGVDTRLVLDFVLHPGAHGPGSDWAAGAKEGDEVMVLVPRRGESYGGIEWSPGDADRLLLVGDETAVPAVCSILKSLPETAAGHVFLEVPTSADVQDFRCPAGVQLTWLPRDGASVGARALPAVADHLGFKPLDRPVQDDIVDMPWETPTYSSSGEAVEPGGETDGRYAWIAGESRMVIALRRHLVNDLDVPRKQVCFMGYWREGVSMRS